MQVGIRVPPAAPVPEVTKFIQRCEEAGFDAVGVVDSQMTARDLMIVLSQAATATKRVRLMPAVTNPVTRHASVLASCARSLDELAPGRIEIWMGRGGAAVRLAGLRAGSIQQTRETIQAYRRLLTGEWDAFAGTHSHMDGARHVPIYLAAAGPRALALAGEVADGVLLGVGLQLEALAWARARVENGARAAGRDPAEIDVVVSAHTVIREDREEARAWAGPLCAEYLGDPAWLESRGIDGRGLQMPPELHSLYPDPSHAADWALACRLSEFIPHDLRGELADALGIIGTPEDCLRRLEELDRAGFDRVHLQALGSNFLPEAEVSLFGETIRPALQAQASEPSSAR
jgi:5,10-methylenetetrahydromethanopterin reductase